MYKYITKPALICLKGHTHTNTRVGEIFTAGPKRRITTRETTREDCAQERDVGDAGAEVRGVVHNKTSVK